MIVGYEFAINSAAALTVATYAEFYTGATRRVKFREVGAFAQTAVAAGKTLLARPAAIGVTPTAVGPWTPQDPADAPGTLNSAIAWGTAPTQPTQASGIHRQFDLAGTVGSGVIFTWPADGELVLPVSKSIVVWNNSGSTGPILSRYVVGSE